MSTDTINTAEPQEEAQDYSQAMIEKGEQLERNNNPNQQERPDWLPEKFNSVEDMAEAYANLENKLGSPEEEEEYEMPSEEDEYGAEEEEVEYDENAQAADVQEAVEEAGIDFDVLQDEYNELGGLSQEAYEALEEAGFSQDLVDTWISGQEALASNYSDAVVGSVGGVEAYSEMIAWGADNLEPSEIAAYDRAVNSGDIGMAKLAVDGLANRYQAAEGVEPSFLDGRTATTTGGGYESWAEVTTAMRDSRYESDPAYRQTVTAKLSRSELS